MSALDQSGDHDPQSEGPELMTRQEPTLPILHSVSPLTRDFLAWLASAPRTYAEAMEAWRTSCPRFTIWEDALGDDLIRLERGGGKRMGQALVTLTPRGRSVLRSQVTQTAVLPNPDGPPTVRTGGDETPKVRT